MAYKHDAVVRAWLDGKQTQLKYSRDEPWIDYNTVGGTVPAFAEAYEFRIKPSTVTVTYRRYLYRSTWPAGEETVKLYSTNDKNTGLEKHSGFIKWLDAAWVTEEIEL